MSNFQNIGQSKRESKRDRKQLRTSCGEISEEEEELVVIAAEEEEEEEEELVVTTISSLFVVSVAPDESSAAPSTVFFSASSSVAADADTDATSSLEEAEKVAVKGASDDLSGAKGSPNSDVHVVSLSPDESPAIVSAAAVAVDT